MRPQPCVFNCVPSQCDVNRRIAISELTYCTIQNSWKIVIAAVCIYTRAVGTPNAGTTGLGAQAVVAAVRFSNSWNHLTGLIFLPFRFTISIVAY